MKPAVILAVIAAVSAAGYAAGIWWLIGWATRPGQICPPLPGTTSRQPTGEPQ